MVKLTKSPLPPNVKIESENDYRKGMVFKILANDCHKKCYICEDKPTSINVEHIIPCCKAPALKFDWQNLLIACAHCNNIKLSRFSDILNPLKCDPENHIELSIDVTEEIIEKVQINPITEDDSTLQTAKLLELVYNGGSTDMKEFGSANLRNDHLMPNIRLFYQYIDGCRNEPELGYDKEIRKEIERSSAFAAFKRKIVREDPELSVKFEDDLKI
jgi:hypothetical protein